MGRLPVVLVALALAGCLRPHPPAEPPPVTWTPGPGAPPANGSLWRADLADNYAFRDLRAYFPGDLLTVVVTEKSQGKKDASTEAKAESSISASVEDFFGVPASAVKLLPKGFNPESIVKAAAARESTGDGATSRTGNLSASITVRVVEVDPGGNLRVRGDKVIRVNREDQYIVLSGTVRPQDIAADNTVLSTRLADARIDYFGKGVVADKQGVPMTHRLFDWIWPF